MNTLKIRTTLLTFALLSFLYGCNNNSATTPTPDSTGRGEPLLIVDAPSYEEYSKTFSLAIMADSTEGATVTYFLLDGDSLIAQSTDGSFKGISPMEEGYNVQARVAWEDTTIITPIVHVLGFVIPREPVEKLSNKELQQLINSKDEETLNLHLTQNVKLTVSDSQVKVTLLHDVFLRLENNVWDSVTVQDIAYDENNLITSITLKAKEREQQTDNSEEFYDEY